MCVENRENDPARPGPTRPEAKLLKKGNFNPKKNGPKSMFFLGVQLPAGPGRVGPGRFPIFYAHLTKTRYA